MNQVRGVRYVDFDGAKLTFFLDLSRCKLMQDRPLKPLFVSLQDAQLPYRWGFPFSLSATKDGRQVTLRNRDDLPRFLESLELPQVDIPDWRASPDIPLPARPDSWQTARRRSMDPGEGPLAQHLLLAPHRVNSEQLYSLPLASEMFG